MRALKAVAAAAAVVVLIGAMPGLAHAVDKDEFIKSVNKNYYNASERGLKGFDCEVGMSIFDQMKEMLNQQLPAGDPSLAAVNNLRFRYIHAGPEDVRFETTEFSIPSNPDAERSIRDMAGGVEMIARGFFMIWTDFTMTEPFGPDDNIKSIAEGENYEVLIEEPVSGMNITIAVDKDYRVRQFLATTSDGKESKTTTELAETEHGYIISGYEVDINKGSMRSSADIAYGEYDGFKIPSLVKFSNESTGAKQEFELEIRDCKLLR